jgi:hypothetical protein
MKWNEIKQKDLEKVFNEIFNPELLYGFDAILYDDAIEKSNNFGTTWQQEMQKDEVYINFLTSYLENEGVTTDDFSNN